MSEYGSRLLLRRISLSKELRISTQHRVDGSTGMQKWTICAFDDSGHQSWMIEEETLDCAARTLARQVGLSLPSDELRRWAEPDLFQLRQARFGRN